MKFFTFQYCLPARQTSVKTFILMFTFCPLKTTEMSTLSPKPFDGTYYHSSPWLPRRMDHAVSTMARLPFALRNGHSQHFRDSGPKRVVAPRLSFEFRVVPS